MTKNKIDKKIILDAAKTWLRETIAVNHIKNTAKLSNPDEFNINPFLVNYLARFLTGKNDPEGIAKALIYPRVLGTSITTSLGTNLQKFIPYLKGAIGNEAMGSIGAGMDIEFIDQIDGRKKYCQLKAGPNNINSGGVEVIDNHFKKLKNLARTNNIKVNIDDLIVGVLYGERHELSGHFLAIENKYHYPVYIGQEFWHRLTGDKGFYFELSQALASVAVEFDGTELLEKTIKELSEAAIIKKLAGEL